MVSENPCCLQTALIQIQLSDGGPETWSSLYSCLNIPKPRKPPLYVYLQSSSASTLCTILSIEALEIVDNLQEMKQAVVEWIQNMLPNLFGSHSLHLLVFSFHCKLNCGILDTSLVMLWPLTACSSLIFYLVLSIVEKGSSKYLHDNWSLGPKLCIVPSS